MRTAFVTGASGFIGSRLAYKLLSAGWNVHVLGRAKRGISFKDRAKSALEEIYGQPVESHLSNGLHCHETDICDPDLTISKSLLKNFSRDNSVLFHVAGDTRFYPKSPESQRKVNVKGSVNVISSLQDYVKSVVHVSTAYVAGRRQGLVLENELDKGQALHNNYEKSKLDAEIAVSEFCDKAGVPLTIVRPSIITNDTKTGRSSAFTHLNAIVEVISRIQKHYGISDGQVVNKEIRMPFNPISRPNLAPVDPIVDSLIEIGTSNLSEGKTFHLCHPNPQTNSEIIHLVAEAFGVKDKIELLFVSEFPKHPTWTEEMIVRSLKPYQPYLNESCTFDLTNTRTIIPGYDSRFSPITLEYLKKVIEFQRHQPKKSRH